MYDDPTPQDIFAEAEREIMQERRRAAVNKAKERLIAKAARPWWARIFPWRIKIERRS